MSSRVTEFLIVSVFLYLVAPWLGMLIIVVSLLQFFMKKMTGKEPVVVGS